MKLKQIQLYSFTIGAALLFGVAGYVIGQIGREQNTELATQAEADHVIEIQAGDSDDSSVEALRTAAVDTQGGQTLQEALASSEILSTDESAYAAQDQQLADATGVAQAESYELRKIENGLSVIYQDVALAHLEIPDGLPTDVVNALEDGLYFSSLEEMEGWLEAFDT